MSRPLVLVIMLLALLWQAVAMASPDSGTHGVAGLDHAVLHWHEEGHHHHPDGTVLQDDSQASTLHLLGDHLSSTTALLPAPGLELPSSPSEPPCGRKHTSIVDPFLDGLLRPPRPRR